MMKGGNDMFDVVIVEDDPMVAMINKQYVCENRHFNVKKICSDGQQALDYLTKNKTDLIILDMYMPRIDGLTLFRKIRESGIPVSVIMVTAANDSAAIEEAFRLGIVDYLVKPFSSQRFGQALDTFLIRQNAFSELTSFTQQHIDAMMGVNVHREDQLPKGIQTQTLDTIRAFISEQGSAELAGEEIADRVGLSRVTVRRYMNYLLEKGEIFGRMNYETGGRPCMVYRKRV